ncbi:tRNA pseudouridine synthase A TruA [Methanobrevibacter ruminantium M1]|uniref:tRNA pseudouridine synthase A n=1 Tax=Methanobrevibacter ruminantium (strain ATCC 35063 / DSM 1093 / JCM 13430 / OCM 146 / M1) TaxID=634498 RepID=D3DZ03_METRM|nr:tRNA pseudouridine(38-40) synthase TruA [Methanobrevibacter ruminantium]ADC47553.1 tRNA pseudouridine synthase A TruA [Methanobrevibacter ruminantium M1]
MKRTALKIAYIGTHFHGFQRQPDVRTVEEELIYHLRKLEYIDDLKASRFRIAGRTDAGVHSLGNVISFQSEKEVRVNQINNSLPDDIQIIAWAPVRFGFKPRFAKRRWYRYILFEEDLDIDLLRKTAEVFKGTHDFTNFTKRKQKTTVRTIEDIRITKPIIDEEDKNKKSDFAHLNKSYSPIFVDIYGESFLWNMVRKMMRIFLDVNYGKLTLDDVERLLNPEEGEPRAYIKVVDAENLILMDIEYEGIRFRYDDYACERFRRYLIDNLFELQKTYSITESMLNCLDDLI